MRLFGRNKKKETVVGGLEVADPEQGMARLYSEMMTRVEDEFAKFVEEHIKRMHEPGGYAREKQQVDFVDLGMGRKYLDALDDPEFSVLESVTMPQTRGRKRGIAQVVTRWIVRGVHARPLAGIPPSGSQVTIDGVTLTTFRDYKLRVEYTYWEFPELTRTVLER